MREILFRGKVKNGLEWIFGYLSQTTIVGKDTYNALIITKPSEKLYEHNWEEVVPETVGQYTGLTDKNGIKIFEGDIIKHYNDGINPNDFVISVIKWDYLYSMYYKMNIDDCSNYHIHYGCKYEIIGNIHDNPELLKETDELEN